MAVVDMVSRCSAWVGDEGRRSEVQRTLVDVVLLGLTCVGCVGVHDVDECLCLVIGF